MNTNNRSISRNLRIQYLSDEGTWAGSIKDIGTFNIVFEPEALLYEDDGFVRSFVYYNEDDELVEFVAAEQGETKNQALDRAMETLYSLARVASHIRTANKAIQLYDSYENREITAQEALMSISIHMLKKEIFKYAKKEILNSVKRFIPFMQKKNVIYYATDDSSVFVKGAIYV